jgi:NDP-sugar pyrophosphorylase family protein
MKALLLSAGLGTRLKPFTDKHPKALAPVHGRSLLEWNIRNLQRFGIFDIVVNVHHFANQIIDVLQRENGFGSRFEISDESAVVLETGGGLKKTAPFFNQEQNLLVMNVDMLTNADISKMITFHEKNNSLATLAVQQRISSRYFLFDENMRLKGWENVQTGERKPATITGNLTPYAFSGIQILSASIFTKIAREGKFSLVDVYLDLCTTENIIGLDHTGDLLLDVGKPDSIAQAETLFRDML